VKYCFAISLGRPCEIASHHFCRRHSPIGIPSSIGMPMAGATEVDFTGQALWNACPIEFWKNIPQGGQFRASGIILRGGIIEECPVRDDRK